MRGGQGKYPHIAKLIRSRIVRGVYGDLLPGEDRLARELNVSPGTVRTALAYLEGQGFVLRKRRRGTFVVFPDSAAGERKRAFVDLFLPGYEGAIWAVPVLDAVRETASGHGLTMRTTDLGRAGTTADPLEHEAPRDDWQAEVLARAGEPRVAGSILLGMPVDAGDALAFADARCPMIVLDCEIPEGILSSVVWDHRGAGALAARHLVQLGHQRIAYVHLKARDPKNQSLRLAGIRETSARVGLAVACDISCATREALSDQFKSCLADPHRPTGVICDTVGQLSRVVKWIRESGLRVPEDVSIVGIGGGRDTLPSIDPTVILLGHHTMGKRAVELLLDEDALNNPRREVIPCRLELGSTSAPPCASG